MTGFRGPVRHPRPMPWVRIRNVAAPTLVLTLLALVPLLVGAALVASWSLTRNTFTIRNRSGSDLLDVRFVVRSRGEVHDESIGRIADGEEVSFRFHAPDSSADLTFRRGGSVGRRQVSYMDLWSGESRVFDVPPDGEVVVCDTSGPTGE